MNRGSVEVWRCHWGQGWWRDECREWSRQELRGEGQGKYRWGEVNGGSVEVWRTH